MHFVSFIVAFVFILGNSFCESYRCGTCWQDTLTVNQVHSSKPVLLFRQIISTMPLAVIRNLDSHHLGSIFP